MLLTPDLHEVHGVGVTQHRGVTVAVQTSTLSQQTREVQQQPEQSRSHRSTERRQTQACWTDSKNESLPRRWRWRAESWEDLRFLPPCRRNRWRSLSLSSERKSKQTQALWKKKIKHKCRKKELDWEETWSWRWFKLSMTPDSWINTPSNTRAGRGRLTNSSEWQYFRSSYTTGSHIPPTAWLRPWKTT